jgi:hypothetical protein
MNNRAWTTALVVLVGVVFGACVAAGVLAVLGARAQASLPCEGRAAVAVLAAPAASITSASASVTSSAAAHLLHTVTDAVRNAGGSHGAIDAVIRLATWCPFACVLVAVDTPAQRQAVFDSLTTTTTSSFQRGTAFQRAGNAPFTARLTGVPYDNLVYVVLKKPVGAVAATSAAAASSAAAAILDDDPTPALPAAEVLTPDRARALRALNTVFGGTHYVTPKRK